MCLTACAGPAAPTVTSPDPTYSPAPSIDDSCAPLPLGADAWAERLTRAGTGVGERAYLEALLRQAQRLSPALRRWTWDDLSAALASDAGPGVGALATAYLNLADGRLHRLSLPAGDSGYASVAALLQAAESQMAGGRVDPSLLATLESVSSDEGLARRACAQLVRVRSLDRVESLVRWEDGITEAVLFSRPSADDFPWLVTTAHPSPDYRTLALETCSLESGGPLLLLDMESGEWLNANRQYGLALAESGRPHPDDESAHWQVIDWHPDSSHLLLAVEAQNLAFWLDLGTGAHQRITLAEAGEAIGGERHLALLPDGSGIAYVSDDGHRLVAYHFATGERREMLRLEEGAGRINYPRFCPGGDRVAFITEPAVVGSRRQCSLEVVALDSGEREILAQESLCLDSPRWSPEGEAVALSESQYGPGSTWMLDPTTGEYLVSTLESVGDCRLPTFARTEAGRVTAQISDLPAEWAAAVGEALAGTDTAHFIP